MAPARVGGGECGVRGHDASWEQSAEVIVMQPVGWHVEVEFQEDDTSTNAAVLLRLPDNSELRARGNAKRNPADPAQPRIGEEIAAARALSDLAHQLLDKAAAEIQELTHKPTHLTA
jgi:hypothetical protein